MRHLGDLDVSDIGLGCLGMATAYGRPDTASARRTVARALEAGITLFDTAEMYVRGSSESVLGAALGGVFGVVQVGG